MTGHSLGGAMASIAAATAVKKGYFTSANVLLYDFGQPRTGDNNYAAAHDTLVSVLWTLKPVGFFG